jgi:hypothetical protein
MTDNENALVVSPFLHQTPTLFTPTPKAAQRIVPEPSLVTAARMLSGHLSQDSAQQMPRSTRM